MPLTGAAAARLYDDHVDAVHALVSRRVGPSAGPAVVGEVFEHAVRSWDRFDQERGSERMFLFGAAIVVLRRHGSAERDHLRSLSVRNDVADTISMADPLVGGIAPRASRVVGDIERDDQVGASEAPVGSILMAAIADLPPDDRDIVLLSLWESCAQAAIAEALDLSVGTVRSALGRIRRDLKAAMTPENGRS